MSLHSATGWRRVRHGTAVSLRRRFEQGDVAAVVITQNKEVPTGVLRVTLENGEIKYVNVTDVNESEKLLEQYEDVEVDTTDVARDSMFLTTLLPVLLMGLLMILFFSMMNRQAGGGNAENDEFRKKPRADDQS